MKVWHKEKKVWHKGKFGTKKSLAQRKVWHKEKSLAQ